MIRLVDIAAQHAPIRGQLEDAITRVLDSSVFVLGEEVENFEYEFAAFCGVRNAIAVNSGTSALHLALLALGIGAGDEVISVANTFAATIAAIRYTGARPVFIDTEPHSQTMSPELLSAAFTSRTKAVLPVHLYGQCADIEPIAELARRHNAAIVEDAAQAHGALYRGRRAGSLGDVGCFSFYPAKNLGALGEGGAVVTDDNGLAAKLRKLRDHGQSRKYHHELVGYNYRMDAIQAAILRIKLRSLDDWNKARRSRAAIYRQLLANSGAQPVAQMPYGTPVYHVFAVQTSDRDRLKAYLSDQGIETGIHYPIPVHLQTGYRDLGYRPGDLPQTERNCRQTLSMPMYPELPIRDLEAVCSAVRQYHRAMIYGELLAAQAQ